MKGRRGGKEERSIEEGHRDVRQKRLGQPRSHFPHPLAFCLGSPLDEGSTPLKDRPGEDSVVGLRFDFGSEPSRPRPDVTICQKKVKGRIVC